MKRLLFIFSSILVLAGAISFGVTYLQKSKTDTVASSSIVQVDLLGDRAEPSVVSVEKGKYVQFNTKDDKIHDIGQGSGETSAHVAHDDGKDEHNDTSEATAAHNHPSSATVEHEHAEGTKQSGSFGKGQAYRIQFNETGTLTFHDHLNPKISIVVVVYEPDNK